MMECLEQIAQNSEMPLFGALALGLLTAIAPCPLATNITATAFIAKTISDKKKVLLSGVLYTLGRMVSYTLIAAIIYFGSSKFQVAKFLQSNGEKYIGFVLVLLGLIMLDIIKLNFLITANFTEKLSAKFKTKGLLGSLLLGVLFAMAFCPYSGALYFGMLIPLTIKAGLMIPVFFSFGTGLPVLVFAYLIAFTLSGVGKLYHRLKAFELWFRRVVSVIFIVVGLYYIYIFFFK